MLYLSICVYIYVDVRIRILYMCTNMCLSAARPPPHSELVILTYQKINDQVIFLQRCGQAIEACLGDPPDLAKTGIQMVCFSTAYVVICAVSTAFT